MSKRSRPFYKHASSSQLWPSIISSCQAQPKQVYGNIDKDVD